MMINKIPVTTLLLILVVALVTWNLRGCFIKVNKPEQMIRNEEKIKYLEEKRLDDSIHLVERIQWYDSLISLSKMKSSQLGLQYKSVKKEYEKIPAIVNDFDRDQLRRAITDY